MENAHLTVWAEPWFVAGWFLGGAVSATLALQASVGDAQGWRAQRWAWAGVLLFLSLVGLLSFARWARKQRSDPGSLRVTMHRLAVEWVASSSFGALLAQLAARQLQASPAQEWAMAVAASLGAAGLALSSRHASLARLSAVNPRARDWLILSLLPVTGCSLKLTWGVIAYPSVGAQPLWDTPAFWGFSALFVGLVYAWSLPAVWLLMRGGFLSVWSSPQSTRDVLSRHAGPKRLSLMGVMGLTSMAATLWLAQRTTLQASVRAEVLALSMSPQRIVEGAAPRRLKSHELPKGSLTRALHVGLEGNVERASAALLGERRRVAVLRIEAAERAAVVLTHLAPDGALGRVVAHLREARRALHWGNVSGCRRHLGAATHELAKASPAAHQPQRAVELERYHGAQVLNVRGEVVGRVINSDTGSMELGLTESPHQALWPWSRKERRVVVHPDSLLLGRPRILGVTNVVVPSLSPFIVSR